MLTEKRMSLRGRVPPQRARAMVVILTLCLALAGLARPCEAGKKRFAHVWWAADSSWAVGGFGKLRPGLAEEVMQKKPADLDGMKGVELELTEPGVWLGFGVAFNRIQRVVFTKNTKFVLIDKLDKRIESEAIVFWPDRMQTTLFDSRKAPIVVTKTGVWCNPRNGYPSGIVKFALGSVEVGNIVAFEVVGAVVDTSR